MAVLKAKTTIKHLTKKGFTQFEGDHHWFEFWHNGVFITRTKTSHNDQDIHDKLIGLMSKQCRVSSSFFKDFATCKKSKEEYIAELQSNNVI
jgi:predicted RNA binding protein YcfA (HicA-like mRNA interferase family)